MPVANAAKVPIRNARIEPNLCAVIRIDDSGFWLSFPNIHALAYPIVAPRLMERTVPNIDGVPPFEVAP